MRVRFDVPTAGIDKADQTHQAVTNRFSLRAFDRGDPRKEITLFEKALTFILQYDPKVKLGGREQDLAIVYWDVTKKRWMPIPGSVDISRHTITALTKHFTDYGTGPVPDILNYLPNLESAEPDLYTGAASLSYNFDLPPGRNNLVPKLGLSYSSSDVDMMSDDAQASFVGAGCRMSTSYIARDTRNTYSAGDDVFTLVQNGAGYDLYAGTDGYYHTGSEQFWRISYEILYDRWQVTTNDGTRYQYGYSDQTRAVQGRVSASGEGKRETYAWWLEKVIDTHGNEISYGYLHDQASTTCGTTGVTSLTYDNALYPNYIQYNGTSAGGFLSFVVLSYQPRTDYKLIYPQYQCGPAPYQSKRLDTIEIKNFLAVGNLQLIRRYVLDNNHYSTFPGVRWPVNNTYGRLTLQSITQYPSDQTPTLPAFQLTYQNNRLRTADNGIGGSATFDYDVVAPGPSPSTWGGTNWSASGAAVVTHVNWNGTDVMRVSATGPGVASAFWDVPSFTPGATYQFVATIVGIDAGDPTVSHCGIFQSSDGYTNTVVSNLNPVCVGDNASTQVSGTLTLSD